MKVLWLFTTADFPIINGGNLRHILLWWLNLKNVRGIECVLVLSSPKVSNIFSLKDKFESEGLRTYAVPDLYPFYNALFGAGKNKMQEILDIERPDVVHSLLIQSDIIASYYKKKFGYKCVSSLEGNLIPKTPKLKYYIYYLLNLVYRKRIDRTVAISHYTYNENLTNGFIMAKYSSIIHSGLNTKMFKMKQYDECLSYNIGYLANISRGKLPFLFVDVAQLLLEKHKNIIFHVGGIGVELENMKKYVESKGISNNFFFHGYVDNVNRFMLDLDFLIFTSEREGLPWTILEAMASGIPVIASSVGGVPEVIRDGYNGFLIQHNEKYGIAKTSEMLIQNSGLLKELSINARKTVEEQYSSQKEADAFLSLYNDLLTNKMIK